MSTTTSLTSKILKTLLHYLKSQFLLTLIITLLTFGLLSLLNVSYALPLAFLTGALSVLPFFGITLAAIITALVAILDTARFLPTLHPIFEGLVLLVIYFLINQLIDLVIFPYLIGKATKIPPTLLLLSTFLGTILLGPLGTFLAVPTTLVLLTIYHHHHPKPPQTI